MKVRTIVETEISPTREIRPAGTEIEHPDAYKLYQLGLAEPVDDAAKEKAAEWDKHLKAIRENQSRLQALKVARKLEKMQAAAQQATAESAKE